MSDLTDDPNDPRLTRGTDDEPVPQADAYLVLSEAERAQGFIRPVRATYIHAKVTNDPVQGDLRTGAQCGVATTMSLALAETYARDPKFYGATYCVGCRMHRPVAEFCWEDGTVVGS